MAEITITLNSNSPIVIASVKNSLQTIADNFTKENQAEIAKLSKLPNANDKLKDLFNNPLFKMAIR
ncbi:MAG: hypothetical protein JST26_04865 [Bacteroidetes bacterium]|nr:hypothetical protein [Bacteroidota bacterium]